MKKKQRHVSEIIIVCLIAAAVPALLILDGIQARRYENLSDEVSGLEKKQEELVEDNKKLVTDISLLSSTDRIEKIAENDLGMHKAETDDIVRVEMKGAKK
ncbi:MAG TPA: cell division protein FtsL [Treponema sp.]|nr:cell division protein FtsL [Treponema sp.]